MRTECEDCDGRGAIAAGGERHVCNTCKGRGTVRDGGSEKPTKKGKK